MHFIFKLTGLAVFLLAAKLTAYQNSWVESANHPATDFPLQNLPYGVFKTAESAPSICVAIGEEVLNIHACVTQNLFADLSINTQNALQQTTLNALMSLSDNQQQLVRKRIYDLLNDESSTIRDNPALRNTLLLSQADIELLLPINIGDYTDFYASLNHASHVGTIMRPENPLMPNYKHMPIGYHGRSSSIIASGTTIVWPSGQILKSDGQPAWDYCQTLDYELEMGAVIGAGNSLGKPIPLEQAKDHIFGFVLLNDWSARDIQRWEYQPLGPFNGKNFATTISPWVVTAVALAPFQTQAPSRAENDPPLLDYLNQSEHVTYDIIVEAYLSSEAMRKDRHPPLLICRGNLKDLYWTFDQMVCQHTSTGCNLRTGDLLGSGTISGSTVDAFGCLLERKTFKLGPLALPDGTTRSFLQDGDEITLHAYAQKEDYPRIGFGTCKGIVSKR